jgi:hypothetical protein
MWQLTNVEQIIEAIQVKTGAAETRFFIVIAALGVLLTAGCGVSKDQIIGVWTQPREHLVDPAPCDPHCRNYQGYEVIWDVLYPENLKLVNFRVNCRNVGKGYPCLFDDEISIDDDPVHHRATIYWRTQSSAAAVRLVADEIR